jgi:Tfp pilus assembly protein PilO
VPATAWLYLFKKPVAEYRELMRTRASLQVAIRESANLPTQMQTLTQEVALLTRRVRGEGPLLPGDQMTGHIIQQLDRLAPRYGVELVSVRPGLERSAQMFQEVPFEIEVKGSYFGLFDWLRDAEEQLAPLVVTQFGISAGNPGEALDMRLKMASYRLVSAMENEP